jgi:hypothetical protein
MPRPSEGYIGKGAQKVVNRRLLVWEHSVWCVLFQHQSCLALKCGFLLLCCRTVCPLVAVTVSTHCPLPSWPDIVPMLLRPPPPRALT